MTTYLSVERFKTMGFDVDLDGVDDVEIATVLNRAAAIVDAYCSVPQVPQPYAFFGGTMTREQHRWRLGTEITRGARRLYTYARPIKEVSSFKIKVTNQVEATIGVNDLYINNSEGYVEVVSLAAVAYGVLPIGVVPNLGLYQPVAEITYDYGWEETEYETVYATDGFTYRTQNPYISSGGNITVEVGGTAVTSGFTIDYIDGVIVFDDHPVGDVKVNYTYKLPRAISQATGDIAAELFAQRDLTAKGMRGLAAIQIAEVTLRRSFEGGNVRDEIRDKIPATALILLEPYRFNTPR
jgi:hypothetical protein